MPIYIRPMHACLPAFVLPALALISCGSQRSSTPASGTGFGSKTDSVFFSLQRTPCFGTCPAYSVEIRSDGSAHYSGRSHAPRVGEFNGTVDRAAMQALVDRAQAIGFFSFQDKYDGPVTDLPSTIIRVNANGKDKKVVGRVKTPPAFKPFADYADSLLAQVRWEQVAETK